MCRRKLSPEETVGSQSRLRTTLANLAPELPLGTWASPTALLRRARFEIGRLHQRVSSRWRGQLFDANPEERCVLTFSRTEIS
jgi:hypothetical protein